MTFGSGAARREDHEAWLRFLLIPGVSGSNQRRLLREFGTPSDALHATASQLEHLIGREAALACRHGADPALVDASLAWLELPRNRLITLADLEYPKLLLQIADPPVALYARGQAPLLDRPALAVVGSRNATPGGAADANAFARALSDAGLTIVSGLALGIDAAAHRGGLAGSASSIAVLGTGADRVYPGRNRNLAHQLSEEGLILTEFPLGTPAVAANFPRRNRIISGLTRGCLVVEAALRSGSLITARLALDQGREVFAIPGSIHSPLAKGCHWLIKQGAKLVESAQDVLEELGMPRAEQSRAPARPPPSPEAQPLLAAMGYDPVDLDTICVRAGLTPDAASAMLLLLELDGHVSRLAGGMYQRLG